MTNTDFSVFHLQPKKHCEIYLFFFSHIYHFENYAIQKLNKAYQIFWEKNIYKYTFFNLVTGKDLKKFLHRKCLVLTALKSSEVKVETIHPKMY